MAATAQIEARQRESAREAARERGCMSAIGIRSRIIAVAARTAAWRYRVRVASGSAGAEARRPVRSAVVEANADFDPGAARTIGETLRANLRAR